MQATASVTDRTRALLGFGVLAGPFYLVVGLAQALTRSGYDLLRHDLSLLAIGPLGWIQIANLVLSGLMTIAAAVGIHRAFAARGGGPSAAWGPRLIGAYGVGLVLAGFLVADPMNGFPVGTPAGPPVAPTWHGVGHVIAGGLGFLALVAACFVLARRFAREGRRGWAVYSIVTGVAFLASFAGIASGASSPSVVLGFWAGVIVAWAWIAAVSLDLRRT